MDQVPPICAPTGDGMQNPAMCPDQGLNPQPFSVCDDAPNKWATQPGLRLTFLNKLNINMHKDQRPEDKLFIVSVCGSITDDYFLFIYVYLLNFL